MYWIAEQVSSKRIFWLQTTEIKYYIIEKKNKTRKQRQSFRHMWIQEFTCFNQVPFFLPHPFFSLPFLLSGISHYGIQIFPCLCGSFWHSYRLIPSQLQGWLEGAGPSQHKVVQGVHLYSRASHLWVIDDHIVYRGRFVYFLHHFSWRWQ